MFFCDTLCEVGGKTPRGKFRVKNCLTIYEFEKKTFRKLDILKAGFCHLSKGQEFSPDHSKTGLKSPVFEWQIQDSCQKMSSQIQWGSE